MSDYICLTAMPPQKVPSYGLDKKSYPVEPSVAENTIQAIPVL